MRSLPSYSVASSSRMGAISLHGPHHSAQKSTRTGWSEALISSSNVASVRAVRVLIGSGFLLGSGGIVPACFSNVPHPCPHSFPVRWRVMPELLPVGGRLGLGLQPALGVDGRHAARTGGGDRLPVDVVLDVAGREHTLDVGAGAGVRVDVAVLVHVDLAAEDVGV